MTYAEALRLANAVMTAVAITTSNDTLSAQLLEAVAILERGAA